MQLLQSTFDPVPPQARGGVVAIGNFDGVHRGHQRLLRAARARAAALGVGAGVMTFEPHPRQVFAPGQAPFRLSTPELKAQAFARHGIDRIFAFGFDRALAELEPAAFAERVLAGTLGLCHVVVGEDYRFGRKRAGDVALLRALGRRLGFGVSALPPVRDANGRIYSSTRVRAALKDGRLAEVADCLGRPWTVEGRVQETLGGVTAVSLGELVRPRAGIYTVRTRPVAQACRGQSSRGQPSREDDARQALAWVLPPEQGRGDRLYLAAPCDAAVVRIEFLDYVGLSLFGAPSRVALPIGDGVLPPFDRAVGYAF